MEEHGYQALREYELLDALSRLKDCPRSLLILSKHRSGLLSLEIGPAQAPIRNLVNEASSHLFHRD